MTSVTSPTSSSETSTESDTTDSDSEVCNGAVGAPAKNPGRSVGTYHKCSVCGQRFASRTAVEIHLATHVCEEPYACTDSSQKFIQKANVIKYERVHTYEVVFVCELCPSKFRTKVALDRHKQLHASGVDLFHCPECGKTILRRKNLLRHLKFHKMEKPYPCHLCPATFLRDSDRNNHVLIHTNEKPHHCHLCQKGYAWKCNLKRHVRRIHGEVETAVTSAAIRVEMVLPSSPPAMLLPVMTSVDIKAEPTSPPTTPPPGHVDMNGEKVSEPAALQPRITSVTAFPSSIDTSTDTSTTDSGPETSTGTLGALVKKPGRSIGRCHERSKCRKRVTNRASAKSHLPNHTSNTPCTCPICGQEFAQWYLVKKHQRAHHTTEVQFVCPLCPSIFKEKSSLGRHKQLHARGVGLYHCHKCAKIFKRKSSLRQHLAWHKSLCPATYINSFDPDHHVRMHTAEKPHRCPSCEKSYAIRGSLKRHMRRSHGGVKLTEECLDVMETETKQPCWQAAR